MGLQTTLAHGINGRGVAWRVGEGRRETDSETILRYNTVAFGYRNKRDPERARGSRDSDPDDSMIHSPGGERDRGMSAQGSLSCQREMGAWYSLTATPGIIILN
jgi:hypothetical protein